MRPLPVALVAGALLAVACGGGDPSAVKSVADAKSSSSSTSTIASTTSSSVLPEPPPPSPVPVPAPARPAAFAPPPLGAPLADDCPTFPADNYWHADVRALPVHPMSGAWRASIGLGAGMHADFGSGTWEGGPIGIPYVVVPADQPSVPVSFDYADESDPGPYPVPTDPLIEGGPASDGDRHVLVVQQGTCTLSELYAAYPNGDGSWSAGSGAVYDLRSNALRPAGWTSADAAGLPILPGLVRYDEVAAGLVDHAIRFTAPRTDRSYLWPARHQAGRADANLPPMGTWMRLRSDIDPNAFPPQVRPIVVAMQVHGVLLADNGSAMYISGAPDPRWDNDALRSLGAITAADFEVVDASSLQLDPNSGAIAGG